MGLCISDPDASTTSQQSISISNTTTTQNEPSVIHPSPRASMLSKPDALASKLLDQHGSFFSRKDDRVTSTSHFSGAFITIAVDADFWKA
jgi:hypothetical protein